MDVCDEPECILPEGMFVKQKMRIAKKEHKDKPNIVTKG